jgi:exodeoxyribonuclease V alpha subunit
MTQPQSATQEVLAGYVERVTYHNAENGFCVLRAKARGHRDAVTVVGHAATISAGEWITASGEWVNDRTHGQQFGARFLRISPPTSADGIEKYLSSGMIRGIGPAYAKKLSGLRKWLVPGLDCAASFRHFGGRIRARIRSNKSR